METDTNLENDNVLGRWLSEAMKSEIFKAQLELENRFLASYVSKLQTISLNDSKLSLEMEYVRVRSMIDAIKQLQGTRLNLIEKRNTR